MRDITLWIAEHLLGKPLPVDEATAAGEPLLVWVQTLWLLVLSIALVLVWSIADRRRPHYATAHAWFRLAVRFVLAAAMFEYGMTKVIPTQFPAPSLVTLVTPVGDLTLSALLWTSIGASPAYQIVTGCVEIAGAILLVLPRTTLLGALITLGATLQVLALNMTFDVGLKLVSLHLVVLALVLLVPDVPRLLDIFVRHRAVAPRPERPLVQAPRANRAIVIAQLVAGIYLLAMYTFINVRFWDVGGGGRPLSALHGIWNVEQLSVDGRAEPSETFDYDRRWRRVIVDAPDMIVFQRTDDSFARYGMTIDPRAGTLALTKGGSRVWRSSFTFKRQAPDRLVLDGTMDGYRIELRLRQVDFDTLRLLNSPFRWIRRHEQTQ